MQGAAYLTITALGCSFIGISEHCFCVQGGVGWCDGHPPMAGRVQGVLVVS